MKRWRGSVVIDCRTRSSLIPRERRSYSPNFRRERTSFPSSATAAGEAAVAAREVKNKSSRKRSPPFPENAKYLARNWCKEPSLLQVFSDEDARSQPRREAV